MYEKMSAQISCGFEILVKSGRSTIYFQKGEYKFTQNPPPKRPLEYRRYFSLVISIKYVQFLFYHTISIF